MGFCPDFQQIKTFGGAVAPPPPKPVRQRIKKGIQARTAPMQ